MSLKEWQWLGADDNSANNISDLTNHGFSDLVPDLSSSDVDIPDLPPDQLNNQTVVPDLTKLPEQDDQPPVNDTPPVEGEGSESDEINDMFVPMIDELYEKGILYIDPEKEYTEGEDGLIEVIEDTAKKRFEEYKESIVSEQAQALIDHLEKGGTVAGFKEAETKFDFMYKDVPLDVKENLPILIKHELETKGWSDEDIEEEIQTLTDLGEEKLEKRAKLAQRYLAKVQEQEIENLKAEEVKKENDRRIAKKKEFESWHEMAVKTKEIAGFKLEDREHKELIDQIFTQNKKGDIKAEKIKAAYYGVVEKDPELALKLALFVKKDFNFSDVEKKVETKKTINFKKMASHYRDKNVTPKGGETVKVEPAKETRIQGPSWLGGYIGTL